MKRFVVFILLPIFGVLLVGCSLQQVTDRFNAKADQVVKQDQQSEQGFVVTSEQVYAAYDTGIGYIKMENMGLTSVPDFCLLLKTEDHLKIRAISLMQNNIKVVNTDLSCLFNLKILNLSYNQIEVVQTLGSLPSLEELRLQKNAINTTENFPEIPSLRRLNLGFNKLKDISGLEGLTNLIALELHHNILEKLDGIEQLKDLQELKVEYNKLKDDQISSVLNVLENITLLTAKGNEIREGLLEKLDALNKLRVEKNMPGALSGNNSTGTNQ